MCWSQFSVLGMPVGVNTFVECAMDYHKEGIVMLLSKLIVILNDWVTELILWLVVVMVMVWGYNIGAELVAMNFGTFLAGDCDTHRLYVTLLSGLSAILLEVFLFGWMVNLLMIRKGIDDLNRKIESMSNRSSYRHEEPSVDSEVLKSVDLNN
jgi:hypothetical protein